MSQLGSMDQRVSVSALSVQLYQLAVQYNHFQRRNETDEKVETLKALFTDLKIQLETNYTLTSEQRKNIRIVAADCLYQGTRTSYKTVHIDIMVVLRNEKEAMRFTNVIGNPAREQKLNMAVKSIASSLRNHFREEIRDSLPDMRLVPFTQKMTAKFQRHSTTVETNITTVRNALLRRFAMENNDLLFASEDEKEKDDSSDATPPPAKKARKTKLPTGGRVPGGQDFWSKVDDWFHRQMFAEDGPQLGKNLLGNKWQKYIEETIKLDDACFQKASTWQWADDYSNQQLQESGGQSSLQNPSNPGHWMAGLMMGTYGNDITYTAGNSQ
ncbi:hypothetical protein C8J56DRAFT_1043295 [Mycena floridula]|nr:hypothetical protein C8J56DRAFT_1043295 [Mycena floridula]